jgi:hypothetical protein
MGAVRFLGCLPIYDYDASLLGSEGKKRNRAMEMFHDCMSILSANIAEFCNHQHTMVCGDGRSYVVQPRIAFVASDFHRFIKTWPSPAVDVMCVNTQRIHLIAQALGGLFVMQPRQRSPCTFWQIKS